MHAADGVHLFAAFAESGVDVNAGARNSHPHRAEVFEDNAHVGRLAKDAHVRQHAVFDQVVRAASVAAVFFAPEFATLRLFDFARNGRDDDVAFQSYSGALQGFHGVGVADERAFHVVDAEAVNESVFDNGMRLVAEAGEKFLAASVGRIHVAVEH